MLNDMISHAQNGTPNEACGVLAGRGGEVIRFYATENAEHSPVHYTIDPLELLRITREIEQQRLEIAAIFHSHPVTQAYPSATDIRLAFYPHAVYCILSLRDASHPELRAFRIVNGEVVEEPVVVERG